MTPNRWGSILPSDSGRELAEEFRKSLSGRLAEVGSAAALDILRAIRDELAGELDSGRRIVNQIDQLSDSMSVLRFADELKPVADTFRERVAGLFALRGSVGTVCTLARSFHDRLVATAFDHAVALLASEGKRRPGLPVSLFASGELGREESVLGARSSFLFIYGDGSEAEREYYDELALRCMAILSTCYPSLGRSMRGPSSYWFGNESSWNAFAGASLRGSGQSGSGNVSPARLIEMTADMRFVCGDAGFGRAVAAAGKALLADAVHSEAFWQVARDVAAMPVAIGIFGRFKTVRSGRNFGKFELKEFVLDPLSWAVRLLAVSVGDGSASFAGRIKAIIAASEIGVSLADRLVTAHQDCIREIIRMELSGAVDGERFYIDPEELGDDVRERLRSGMEDIVTLQRLVHQKLVEVEPA